MEAGLSQQVSRDLVIYIKHIVIGRFAPSLRLVRGVGVGVKVMMFGSLQEA